MTEEPNKQEPTKQEQPTPAPEKHLFDDPSNFQFHAAYLVYSELYDQATSPEVKRELNGQIESLKQNQIDFETFYRNVAHHRKMALPLRQERFALQTQRKKDWRVKEQRQDRFRRHKK
jgi:hypothetical protein